MEDISKPRSVITSTQAKNHLFAAKTLYDEMTLNMLNQKMKVDAERIKNLDIQKEQQRFDATNKQEQELQKNKNLHEIEMQKQKLDSVNSLL
jgi:hypothetical protein